MKKLILIVLLAMSASMAMVSCTEENVQPTQNEDPDNGGSGSDQGGKI